MHGNWMAAAWLLAAMGTASAQVAPAASSAKDLPAMVVSGEVPGPGLWKVSRGDHVMWVLGTQAPLPKDMQWRSHDVEAKVLDAQAVLSPPGIDIGAKGGFFSKLFLLPRLIGIRNNPDGKKLVDVLPPEVYARWTRLKAQYLPHSNGVEKYRPMFAAMKLRAAALKNAGLSDDDVAGELVKKLAKKHDIPQVNTSFKFTIADPKRAIATFRHGQLQDVACLTQTMDRIEHDLPQMQAAANAWATGDVETLAALQRTDPLSACTDAFNGSDLARQEGLQDIAAKAAQSWLAAAEQALAKNRVTFALMAMDEVHSARDYLGALKARGYRVDAPSTLMDDPAPSSSTPASPAGSTSGISVR